MKMLKYLTCWCLLFIAIEAKLNQDFVYNGNDKIWLALDKAFQLDLLKDGQVTDTFSLLPAKDATIEGISNGTNSVTLNIHYSKPMTGSKGGSLNDIKMSFAVTTRTNG